MLPTEMIAELVEYFSEVIGEPESYVPELLENAASITARYGYTATVRVGIIEDQIQAVWLLDYRLAQPWPPEPSEN